jgi:hypothetical protein
MQDAPQVNHEENSIMNILLPVSQTSANTEALV